jgi:CO/xanthine dehydrogenase Mo-binding subunit
VTRWVRQRLRAVDWEKKTSGRELYASDVQLPGTLVGRILRSPHPHARIRHIDTAVARQVPGVHAVVTSADLAPGTRYLHSGEPYRDRPPLADEVVRYVGEEVAAVAAESREAADTALAAIKVTYRRLRAQSARVADSLAGLTNLGSQTGSQCQQTPVHTRRRRAMVSAARSPIGPRSATYSDRADAPDQRKRVPAHHGQGPTGADGLIAAQVHVDRRCRSSHDAPASARFPALLVGVR